MNDEGLDKKTFKRKMYDFFVKRWYLSAIIFTLSSNWFILLQFLGKKWLWLDTNGELAPRTKLVSLMFVCITTVFTVIKTLSDKRNDEGKENGQMILGRLLDDVTDCKESKLHRYLHLISRNITHEDFMDHIRPESEINDIFSAIQNSISNICGINKSNIGLSIIYRFDINDKNAWKWLDRVHTNNDLSLKQLIDNPLTSARQIIDGNKDKIFFADKREAIDKNLFVPGMIDKDNDNIGSIYCGDISLKQDDDVVIMQAIFTITTYVQQLCEKNDNSSINRIRSLIIPAFELRLKIELALFYIREKRKEKGNSV
jgi:hypothetical protein